MTTRPRMCQREKARASMRAISMAARPDVATGAAAESTAPGDTIAGPRVGASEVILFLPYVVARAAPALTAGRMEMSRRDAAPGHFEGPIRRP